MRKIVSLRGLSQPRLQRTNFVHGQTSFTAIVTSRAANGNYVSARVGCLRNNLADETSCQGDEKFCPMRSFGQRTNSRRVDVVKQVSGSFVIGIDQQTSRLDVDRDGPTHP